MLDFLSLFGVTWDYSGGSSFEESPPNSQTPASGDDRIREGRVEVGSRADQEHAWRDTASTGACVHREGSARAYYVGTEPTLRPDGATALGASDDGRIWVDSDASPKTVNVWTGSAFTAVAAAIATYQLTNAKVTTATEGSFKKLTLTETENNITSASVTSGVVTLPTGTYLIFITVPINVNMPATGVAIPQTRIRWINTADNTSTYTTPIYETKSFSSYGYKVDTHTCSFIETIAASKTFELQYDLHSDGDVTYDILVSSIMILRIA